MAKSSLTPEEIKALHFISVIVDRRNRLIFIDRILNKGYQVKPSHLNLFRFYVFRYLFSLLVYVVGFSFLSLDMWLSLVVGIVVFVLIEIALRVLLLWRMPLVTVKKEDRFAVSWLGTLLSEPIKTLQNRSITFVLMGIFTTATLIVANYQGAYLLTMICFVLYIWLYTGFLIVAYVKKRKQNSSK